MVTDAHRVVKAIIEYDGTAFAGSQVQPNARTVQGELEKALNRLIGERTRVRLAGRTDAGVHATGQVAAFRVGRRVPLRGGLPELRRRMNAALPPDVGIRSMRFTDAGFDPRRDARWRVYRYRILMGGARRPGERHRTLEIDEALDTDAMQAAADRMVGLRDFAALGADAQGHTIRRLADLRVTRTGNLVVVRVTANAFLKRMVRSLVALLIEVGRGRLNATSVGELLATGARALHGRVAPPRGLTLERVIYESATKNRTSSGRRPDVGRWSPSEGKSESSIP